MLSKKRAAAIAARFGKPPDNRYEDEDFRCIRSYYDYRREKEPETFALDETTWYDLYLDTLFERVSSTGSASGEQLLYYQLRCPAMERDEYERRHGLIRSCAKSCRFFCPVWGKPAGRGPSRRFPPPLTGNAA